MDEVGEFVIRSPAAITGYEGLEAVNREAFREGYFLTGDLGRRDQAGLLYLVGRKKFFINNGPCAEEDLIVYCQGKIAPFKIPSVIEFRDSLPKSPTGKIRKGLLL